MNSKTQRPTRTTTTVKWDLEIVLLKFATAVLSVALAVSIFILARKIYYLWGRQDKQQPQQQQQPVQDGGETGDDSLVVPSFLAQEVNTTTGEIVGLLLGIGTIVLILTVGPRILKLYTQRPKTKIQKEQDKARKEAQKESEEPDVINWDFLDESGYRRVKGDGNCFWRSLAVQLKASDIKKVENPNGTKLYGDKSEENWEQLKQSVWEDVIDKQNKGKENALGHIIMWAQNVSGGGDSREMMRLANQEQDSRLAQLTRDGEWARETAIASAAAALERPINVFFNNGVFFASFHPEGETMRDTFAENGLSVVNHNNVHFDAIPDAKAPPAKL